MTSTRTSSVPPTGARDAEHHGRRDDGAGESAERHRRRER
jgi:hypothetical protein